MNPDILELVKKNKTIPHFFNRLTPKDKKLLCLKKAIHKGNFRAKIWNHTDCNLYLIYLIQEKMIPFWQGITAYVYLIAKMQYTQTQSLSEDDQDVKLNYSVRIMLLTKSGKITALGYRYLVGVMHSFEKINIYLDFESLVRYVLELPRIEQWLIETECDHHMSLLKTKHDSDRLMLILIHNISFIQNISNYGDDPTLQYLVPSSSLINYCLKALNKKPMCMRPILGSLSLERLYQWHENDFHPVSLYAPQVLSNPKNADGYRCGPFPMWLHDIGHIFWASMLSKREREYIFATYIPALRHLHTLAETVHDESSIERLKAIQQCTNDFDLTDILYYADPVKRLKTYLAHTMGKHPLYPICLYSGVHEFEPIGCAEGDTFYFLLHYALFSDKTPDHYKAVYQMLIDFVATGFGYRDPRCINALKILAKNAAHYADALFSSEQPIQLRINHLSWKKLLTTRGMSEELWLAITSDPARAQELLVMVEQGFIFFHPYASMTLAKRLTFMQYLNQFSTHETYYNSYPCANNVVPFRSGFFNHRPHDTPSEFFVSGSSALTHRG
ncbi:hypothetical protein [Rickettsiella grylli]|uniref:Uncharacterized protein n=1 Tax=Rickettsiella grylli TaxID=59196 RepID=A8PMN9_9COXI|nr:hypothetical protein [Rickettsiella grylli]EDP46765.1 hypothetical protein RICGR_0781 [Rickettsiella grylli]